MTDHIKVELTTTNTLTRWPCHVCGGCTDKVEVLAEVLEGPEQGLRVCEVCLEAGNIDERLEQFARRLGGEAAESIRALIGRLQVPTYSAWKAFFDRAEVAQFAFYTIGPDVDGAYAEYEAVLRSDEVFAYWLRQRDGKPRLQVVGRDD